MGMRGPGAAYHLLKVHGAIANDYPCRGRFLKRDGDRKRRARPRVGHDIIEELSHHERRALTVELVEEWTPRDETFQGRQVLKSGRKPNRAALRFHDGSDYFR